MTEIDRETMLALLQEVKSVAAHASLTGSLKRGSRILIETYNRCLDALSAGDPLVGTLFAKIDPENSHIDEVGAAAALLVGYLRRRDGVRYHDGRDEEEHEARVRDIHDR